MADGILGLGSSGSVDLSQDLIDKLKEAEQTSYIDPIDEDIEEKELEIEATDEIASKLDELLAAVDVFDLYTNGTNVFDEVSATTSGTSASFNATDTANINPGTIAVTVDQLARKDVFQSDTITDTEATMDAGTLSVTIGGTTHEFDTTDKTYEELVTEMNYISALDVSLEQVGDSSYRMVIKSAESGTANALTIEETGDLSLGYDNADNHVVTAQNMLATIDGIDYDMSSNKVTLDNGLIITAVEEGDSSISIEKDDSAVLEAIANLANVYNELNTLVDGYVTADDDGNAATISDGSSLRSIMNEIKNVFFGDYGLEDEENIFKYGFTFNSDGEIEIDTAELSEAVTNNFDDLKELFVGYAEKEGLGTALTAYVDDLDSLDGALTAYEDRLDSQLESLNENLESETERIDTKYEELTQRFAQYTVIISEMENAFNSLKLIMDSDSDE